jgi:hypothetical protein
MARRIVIKKKKRPEGDKRLWDAVIGNLRLSKNRKFVSAKRK